MDKFPSILCNNTLEIGLKAIEQQYNNKDVCFTLVMMNLISIVYEGNFSLFFLSPGISFYKKFLDILFIVCYYNDK